MVVAFRLGNKHLEQYASPFSRKDFALPQLFACLALRQFYNLSYRRTEALLADCRDLRDAVGLARAPDHNTLCDAFGTLAALDTFAPMLDELAAAFESAGLLDLDRQPVAADATYFESRHVSRHFERRKRETAAKAPTGGGTCGTDRGGSATRAGAVKGLPKLGIAAACACHLVLSVWAGTGAGGDHPHFEPLAYHAWRRAGVRTIVADAGYDSEAAHELVRRDMACASLIPPLTGRPTDKPPATPYRALMARLLAAADDGGDAAARAAYGQRWQAETVNSMLKRNYGSALRARTPARREREMLLKVMVHNMAL